MSSAEEVLVQLRELHALLKETFNAPPPRREIRATTQDAPPPPERRTGTYRTAYGATDPEGERLAGIAAQLDPGADIAAATMDDMTGLIAAQLRQIVPRTPSVSIDATATARRGMPSTTNTRLQMPGEPLEYFYDRSYRRD